METVTLSAFHPGPPETALGKHAQPPDTVSHSDALLALPAQLLHPQGGRARGDLKKENGDLGSLALSQVSPLSVWDLICAEPRSGSTQHLLRPEPSQKPVSDRGEISRLFQQVRGHE